MEKVNLYQGCNCITRYWVYDEEHDCIAYGKITEDEIDGRKT